MRDDILAEPPHRALAPLDRRRPIATLLQRDVAVREMVIGRFALEFHPRRGDELPSLHATFEGGGEGDEVRGVGGEMLVFERVVEVGARGAVSVPVVVVEVVGAGFGGGVVQVDADAGVVGFWGRELFGCFVGGRGRGAGGFLGY